MTVCHRSLGSLAATLNGDNMVRKTFFAVLSFQHFYEVWLSCFSGKHGELLPEIEIWMHATHFSSIQRAKQLSYGNHRIFNFILYCSRRNDGNQNILTCFFHIAEFKLVCQLEAFRKDLFTRERKGWWLGDVSHTAVISHSCHIVPSLGGWVICHSAVRQHEI